MRTSFIGCRGIVEVKFWQVLKCFIESIIQNVLRKSIGVLWGVRCVLNCLFVLLNLGYALSKAVDLLANTGVQQRKNNSKKKKNTRIILLKICHYVKL